MFNWFKKKSPAPEKSNIKLEDLQQQPLLNGDKVECLRYEMGRSVLVENPGQPNGFYYQSEKTGKKVSFLKMVDAHTGFQKVNKV